MTQKQFEQYKERAFDIFCRTVIRHEGADAFREFAAKAEREVGLSMLSGQEQEALSYTDAEIGERLGPDGESYSPAQNRSIETAERDHGGLGR